MGQKVSPVGLRIGINKNWESNWYADNKNFAKYLDNDVKIRRFLEKRLQLVFVRPISPLRSPLWKWMSAVSSAEEKDANCAKVPAGSKFLVPGL